MATKQVSATVNEDIYEQFEAFRQTLGINRSQAVEEAIERQLKYWIDSQVAEGCRRERDEDAARALASKAKAAQILSDE